MGRLSQEQICQLVKDYEKGIGPTELARYYSVHPKSIYKILGRFGVEAHRSNKPKLASEEVFEMVREYESGAMLEDVAEKHGVRVSTVYYHLAKKLGLKLRKRGWDSRRMIYEENDVATGSV